MMRYAQKRAKYFASIIATAATMVSTLAHAQPSIRIIEKGVYQAETTTRTMTQEATGVRNTVKNPRLISDTVLIYGKLGVRFGVRYVLSGTTEPGLDLNLVIRFPAPGLRDPVAGKRYFESAQVLTIRAGAAYYWEYHFENDWEIVPGVWTFEFWSSATMLASQKFCVIDAASSLDMTKRCLPLLSEAPAETLRSH